MSESEEAIINGDEDRLSSLPDALLITILSLLGYARHIVQTCVLSKRWRNLWTFARCLEFFGDHDWDNESRDDVRFENFVSSFLRLRDDATDLHSFTLSHGFSPYSSSWILYALSHNPKILKIYGHDSFNVMPDYFYTCESVEDVCLSLRSRNDVDLILPDTVFLPKLTKLRLCGVQGNYMDKLLSGCPALESLTLGCVWKMNKNISLHAVKKLYFYCQFDTWEPPPTFYISTPCLEYIYFSGTLGCVAKFKDMYKVKEASIAIRREYDIHLYNCEFFNSLSGDEDLEMSNLGNYSFLKEIFEGELLSKCRTFQNLKKLTLGSSCMHCDFGLLSSFLKHCLNLEILTLFHNAYYCEDSKEKIRRFGFRHLKLEKEQDEEEQDEEEHDENLEEIERFGCEQLRLVEFKYFHRDVHVDRLKSRLVRSTIGTKNAQIILTSLKR